MPIAYASPHDAALKANSAPWTVPSSGVSCNGVYARRLMYTCADGSGCRLPFPVWKMSR